MSNWNNHVAIVMNDGTVKVVGRNNWAQLGQGNNNTNLSSLTTVPNISNVKQTSCGYQFTMFLLNDGTVKGVGQNSSGQLGNGTTNSGASAPYGEGSPVTANVSNVKQIACGADHTMFLLNDGTVKAVGKNDYGQLGLGHQTTPVSTVTAVPGLSGVKQIACGYGHTLFLMNDGTVKGVGMNVNGNLGLGNTTTPILAITNISSVSGVKAVFCNNFDSFFLLNDGTVKACGCMVDGELGLGVSGTLNTSPTTITGLTGVKSIASGANSNSNGGHTIFLLQDGTAKAVGRNGSGQLGLGHTTSPVSTITSVPSLTGIKEVYCANAFTYFLLNDGTVKTVGDNTYGMLANGNTTTPITTLYTSSITGIKALADSVGSVIKAFLVQVGSDIKKIGTLALDKIGTAPATEDMFKTSGSKDLSDLIKTATDTFTLQTEGDVGAGKVFSAKIPVCYYKVTSLTVK